MAALFLVCFLVGLSMTALSLVMGMGHFGGLHLGHAGGAHALGHGGTAHGNAAHGNSVADTSSPTVSSGFLNFTTIMTFVTWFGGVGYLVLQYTALGGVVSLVVATVSGIGGGSVVALFITRVLEKGQTEIHEADYHMPGTAAHVTSTIYPGYAGEITYALAGSTQTSAARSVVGEELPRGSEVVVLKYERGVAYVDTWQRALGEGSDAPIEVTSNESRVSSPDAHA
ncbi:MAG: hypothetical protein M3Z19_06380 [Chloroflexota bacterium]|nr:hypothetical protein [Chloroflexota bacterium]